MAQPLPRPRDFREAEFDRQRAVDAYRIVDTLPEDAYDDIARVAAVVCDAPVALVSLIDRDRQWFKARVGTEVRETPRDEALCDQAIRAPTQLFEVPDIGGDPRFAHQSTVAGMRGARFYAGMPLVTPGGAAIGTVCVVDRQPRRLSTAQRSAMGSLARLVVNLLQDRQRERVLERAALLTPPAGNEDALPPVYRIVLIQVQGHAELVEARGERTVEKILRAFDEALEACLPSGSGDAIDRTIDSAEFVAVLHGDGAGQALECLRKAAHGAAAEAGLSVAIGWAESEDGLEPLEAVFIRADEALTHQKNQLRPPLVAV